MIDSAYQIVFSVGVHVAANFSEIFARLLGYAGSSGVNVLGRCRQSA